MTCFPAGQDTCPFHGSLRTCRRTRHSRGPRSYNKRFASSVVEVRFKNDESTYSILFIVVHCWRFFRCSLFIVVKARRYCNIVNNEPLSAKIDLI